MEDDDFKRFWASYPRRIGKGAARIALARALKKAGLGRILSAVAAQANAGRFADPAFVPYPATWLNQERWDDELAAEAPAGDARRLAARWRDACRAGSEAAKREVRAAASLAGIPWAAVEAEVLKLREAEPAV